MKKLAALFLASALAVFAFADDIFNYVPRTSGYLDAGNGFSVSIRDSGKSYSVFNNTKGETGILAVQATTEQVVFIVRLREFSTNGTASFWRITVRPRTPAEKSASESTRPLSDYSEQELIEYLLTYGTFPDSPERADEAVATSELISGKPDLTGFWICGGRTNDSSVNFRDAAGIKGARVGQYQKGNAVQFTGSMDGWAAIDNTEDYWYSFSYSGSTAWMYGKYLEFGSSVSFTTDMFTGPQVFTSPAVRPLGITAGKPIESLPVIGAEYGDQDNLLSEAYDTGVSTVEILSNGYFFLYQDKRVRISGSAGEIASFDVQDCWYDESSAILYYLQYVYGNTNELCAIDCRTGMSVPVTADETSLYTSTSLFAVSPDGKKIAVTTQSYDWNDCPVEAIEIIDTKAKTHTAYQYDNPATFSNEHITSLTWLSDSDFVLTVDKYQADSVTVIWYKMSGNRLVPECNWTFEAIYQHSAFIPLAQSGTMLVSAEDWHTWHPFTMLLEFKNGRITRKPGIEGSFTGTFRYQGKMYIGAYEDLDTSRNTCTVVIYDDALNEVRRESQVKLTAYSPQVCNIGTAEGEIRIISVFEK